jgi:hypothetical protein
MAAFENLSKVLFEGDVIASDFKTMPGTGANVSRDQLAQALLESMERVGLVKNGVLVDHNQ